MREVHARWGLCVLEETSYVLAVQCMACGAPAGVLEEAEGEVCHDVAADVEAIVDPEGIHQLPLRTHRRFSGTDFRIKRCRRV